MGSASQGVIELRRRSLHPARKTVLCVDDDRSIVRFLARWLERQGYQAVAVSEPEAAVELLLGTPRPFDALITDQTMPGLTGLELARLAVSRRPELVVFLATALDDRLLPDELASSGVSYLVAKPFTLPEVASALGEALGGSQAARRPGPRP